MTGPLHSLAGAIRELEAREVELWAELTVVGEALAALRSIQGPTPTDAPPEAENAVQAAELAPEGFVRAVEALPDPPERAPEEPEETLAQAMRALRESWRDRARASYVPWTPDYLPRGLTPTAGEQLVRCWVEHNPSQWLTARAGAKVTRLDRSGVTFHLRQLEAQGVVAYAGRAKRSKLHPRDHLYARLEKGATDAETTARDGGPAAA